MNAASQFAYASSEQSQALSWQGEQGGNSMVEARGNNTRTVRDTDETSGRVSTADLVDFVKEQALRKRIKEVARLTGLSEKAVANLRVGAAGASAQTITTWCRNDAAFAAEYFRFCGYEPSMPPDLTAVIQKYMRGTGQ